ncbi:MAG: O-antigen ligase C-terminal domain-containing protein [Burkholderiales bacterium]|nr:O-antigen ligase C-terminal domain-containing protein [Burkholderiales bacterium]
MSQSPPVGAVEPGLARSRNHVPHPSSLPRPSVTATATAIAAAAGPSLLAYNVSPSSTFLNQALALALWGSFVALCLMAAPAPPGRVLLRVAAWPALALGVLLLAVLLAWSPGRLPSALALSAAGLLLAALVLLLAGAAARAGPPAEPLFVAFCAAWVVAGVINAAIGGVQVFAPDWPDGDWIARSGLAGRAVGNLRQPNHLSSLLLWSAIAIVPLFELRRLSLRAAAGLYVIMIFAVVLTASRTGVLGVALLTLWGLADRRLSRRSRGLLLLSPLLYAAAWLGLAAWAHASAQAFGGEARLAEGDLSGSRFGIWANTLALIRQHPWAGVGFGEFNLAWTLTPFPGRPTAYFDHAHNLPLHLAAELGLPLGGLVLLLLGAALLRALHVPAAHPPQAAVMQRSAAMMLLLIGLHSLLEYPLWYAYFLLPTAWLFGFGLGRAGGATAAASRPRWSAGGALFVAALLLPLGAALAVADYTRVTAIFMGTDGGVPLAERIERGRRSLFFSHHADYADVTTLERPARPPAFDEAPHYLLDTRLMLAWARALAAAGRLDEARYLAARLREFRNPAADAFFAPCGATPRPEPLPWQCEPPAEPVPWRNFVR